MDFNTQDTRSFDSYMSNAVGPNYFTVLPLLDTIKRTVQLASNYATSRFVPWTATIMAPSFVIAFFTALFHNSTKDIVDDQTVFVSMTAFDEVWDALPLVIWHALVLGIGAVLAQSVIVQFVIEVVYGERLPPTGWKKALTNLVLRHAKLLGIAVLFIGGSLAAVYILGHVLTVELIHMRHDAQKARHKDPLVFGFIALAATVMVLAVDIVVLFCLVWLVCMYANLIPIVMLQQPDSPLELFRIAYVLARDSRSYLVVSWAGACLPGLLASLLTGWILHSATRREGQDFVEWQLGTVAGVIALYLPLLVWIPAVGIHQTVLYVTLRVAKEELTPDVLKADLERLAPNFMKPDTDAVPLTHKSNGIYDDDEVDEDEFEQNGRHKTIELPEMYPGS